MAATSDPSGRWVTVDGRRWRATDPAIPAAFRAELVGELMDARRAVKAAGDDTARTAARRRVQHAKVALGERGEPWWEPTESGTRARLEAAILALASHRAPRTICPSDAARTVGGEGWRRLTPAARAIAFELAGDGRVRVLQRGEEVDETARGPIRIALEPPR